MSTAQIMTSTRYSSFMQEMGAWQVRLTSSWVSCSTFSDNWMAGISNNVGDILLSLLPLLIGDTGRERRCWGSDPGRCPTKDTGGAWAEAGEMGLCGDVEGLFWGLACGEEGLWGDAGLCAPVLDHLSCTRSETGSGSSGMVSGLLVPLALWLRTISAVCFVTL